MISKTVVASTQVAIAKFPARPDSRARFRWDVSLDETGRVNDAHKSATFRNCQDKETAMHLTFIGKDPDSNPTGSPTVYRTDRETWVVQGWMVTDSDALTQMNIPDGETAVEIPARMIKFFRQEDRDTGNG
jgi:hypothetical protein